MPLYDFRCRRCGTTASVFHRKVPAKESAGPACDRCGRRMGRVISGFAFHKSIQSKVEQLDPRYDKMIDASNPDLASDDLIKRWDLDKPIPEEQKKALREKMERYPD